MDCGYKCDKCGWEPCRCVADKENKGGPSETINRVHSVLLRPKGLRFWILKKFCHELRDIAEILRKYYWDCENEEIK